MDGTGAEQTEVGWIRCVLHLCTQVFKKLLMMALCTRFCVFVCIDVYVYGVFVLYTRVGETKG